MTFACKSLTGDDFDDARFQKFVYRFLHVCRFPPDYFEYSSTTRFSLMSGSMSSRSGNDFSTPVIFFASTSTHSGKTDLGCYLQSTLNAQLLLCFFANADCESPGIHLKSTGMFDHFAVYLDALVANELTGFGPRRREPHAVDNIVQTPFQQAQQILTCRAFQLSGFFVVIAKLSFQYAIHTAQLLFFPKLQYRSPTNGDGVARRHQAALPTCTSTQAAERHSSETGPCLRGGTVCILVLEYLAII